MAEIILPTIYHSCANCKEALKIAQSSVPQKIRGEFTLVGTKVEIKCNPKTERGITTVYMSGVVRATYNDGEADTNVTATIPKQAVNCPVNFIKSDTRPKKKH